MKINGFQKMTMLDFPDKLACTVFTPGCNWRCPFCHNARLVTHIEAADAWEEQGKFFPIYKSARGSWRAFVSPAENR